MTTLALTARRWLDDRGPRLAATAALSAAAGVAVLAAGALSLATSGSAGWTPLALALFATLATAAATGVGALPVLVARRVSERVQTGMLGFSAGIMLAASIFSLILPALASGTALAGGKFGGAAVVAAGILFGGWLMLSLDRWLPHEHAVRAAVSTRGLPAARVWLFVFAITLHNVPEGLAVGVAFASGEAGTALPLALGIGLQNMPEGLAVALALLSLHYSPARAALIALATGMVEPVGALIGAGILVIAQPLLPLGLAFAAGAMLFVISHEIIPETHHRKGHETVATAGILAGFIVMMLFDTVLG
jgi:zinc transporter, ZIP family